MAPFPVLIVDDDPDIRDSIQEVLAASDIPSLGAMDGQDALRKLEAQPVGLVLLDLMMPVMDGRQLVLELRRRKIDVPIVLLSAGNELKRIAAELELPAVPKPFELDDLLAVIQRHRRPPDGTGAGAA